MKTIVLLIAVAFTALAPAAHAAVNFVADVKPVLEMNCVRFHNPKGTDFETAPFTPDPDPRCGRPRCGGCEAFKSRPMSLAQILEEVEHLSDEERVELARRLRALELARDPQRTADMSARLDRSLAGTDVVTEDQLLSRLRTRGLDRP